MMGAFDLKVRKRGEKDAILNFFSKKSVSVGREGRDISIELSQICSSHARIACDPSGQLTILQ
jgi:hypothetical protein